MAHMGAFGYTLCLIAPLYSATQAVVSFGYKLVDGPAVRTLTVWVYWQI